MKKVIYIVKLYDCNTEIICKNRDDLIETINTLIDKELYKNMTIGQLQNIFKYSTQLFYDKDTEKYREVDLDRYSEKEINNMFHSNKKYTDIYLTPYIEYIISWNWIDYTEELFETYYPHKIEVNEKTKRKYREKIINSLVKKNIHSLDLNEDASLNLEINSCISEED
jgi:hypothetical protein